MGIEDSLAGISTARCIARHSPILPKHPKGVPVASNRKGARKFFNTDAFLKSNLSGHSEISPHNNAVNAIAARLKEMERQVITNTGAIMFDCSLAKMRQELQGLLHRPQKRNKKPTRLPSLANSDRSDGEPASVVICDCLRCVSRITHAVVLVGDIKDEKFSIHDICRTG